MRFICKPLVLALVCFGITQVQAESPKFCSTTTITNGQVLPSGINSSSKVVGTVIEDALTHGFIWSNGNGQLFNFPGASGTSLAGINDHGAFTGTIAHPGGTSSAFEIDENGVTTIFDVPNALATSANAINNRGEIVGSAQSLEGFAGFLRSKNVLTTIQFPGSVSTAANGINDAGVIVGDYLDSSNNPHGFVLVRDKYVTFDKPGAFSTDVRGISNTGEIVGVVHPTPDANGEGFKFKDGKFTTFELPGSSFTALSGVNQHGNSVGNAITTDANGGTVFGPAFLLTCHP